MPLGSCWIMPACKYVTGSACIEHMALFIHALHNGVPSAMYVRYSDAQSEIGLCPLILQTAPSYFKLWSVSKLLCKCSDRYIYLPQSARGRHFHMSIYCMLLVHQ